MTLLCFLAQLFRSILVRSEVCFYHVPCLANQLQKRTGEGNLSLLCCCASTKCSVSFRSCLGTAWGGNLKPGGCHAYWQSNTPLPSADLRAPEEICNESFGYLDKHFVHEGMMMKRQDVQGVRDLLGVLRIAYRELQPATILHVLHPAR